MIRSFVFSIILLLTSCTKTDEYSLCTYQLTGSAKSCTINILDRNEQTFSFVEAHPGWEYWWLDPNIHSRKFYIQAVKTSTTGKISISLVINHHIVAVSKGDSIATISVK